MFLRVKTYFLASLCKVKSKKFNDNTLMFLNILYISIIKCKLNQFYVIINIINILQIIIFTKYKKIKSL